MPRFYLHIREHDQLTLDKEGADLPDLKAALTEAEEGAREMLADALRARKEVNGKIIEITDASGTVVGTVKLRDILC